MCLSFHRHGHRPAFKKPEDHQHGGRSVMRLLVDTTTLISPTHNGHHRRRPVVTTKDLADASAAYPNSPVIFLGHTTLAQLEHIFRDLCGRSPTFYKAIPLPTALVAPMTLSRQRLTVFLEHTQGETLAVPLEKARYKFEEFLEVWCYHYSWNAARPPPPAEVLDLSLPISNYFISSSHNTYLVGNQLSSEASVGEYQKVLENNCRCIEIDVWNPPTKSGRQANHRSKSPQRQSHRRHLSSSSVANSIHDSFEVVANLFSAKISRSRASSFSQQSVTAPSQVEQSNTIDPEPPVQKTPDQVALSRLREENSTLVAEEAVDDDEVEEAQDDACTAAGDSETPQTSQGTSETTVAKISVTAPDAEIATPAEVPDEVEVCGEDEPVVMHAHNILYSDWTLGTHVPFRDVCRAVKNTAFRTNPLPIIVSLEVHTNAVQQRKMVKIMKEEWGDMLLDQPLNGTDPRLRLPTLGELQNKILVKVKKPYTLRWPSAGSNGTAGSQGMSLGASLAVLSPADSGGTSGSEDDVTGNNVSAAATKNARITEELGSLAIYTESRHFHAFSDRDAKSPSHIFSLSETAIQALHLKSHEDLFNHNKKYLMRAYPHATKHVTSSNPDPASCWRRGVQMVALNWQTLDKAMMLNHGMFDGSNGWVLKPQGYRGTASATAANSVAGDSVAATPVSSGPKAIKIASHSKPCAVAAAEPVCTLDLYITVLAGQHLPLPPALQKKNKKKTGAAGNKIAATAGIVTGRGPSDFRPVVKCELNVEHAEERCPEAVATSRVPTMGPTANPPSAATVPGSPFSLSSSAAGLSSPSAVKLPEASLKQKTTAGESDHPDWGMHGETLRFMNVTGIVESLSFVAIYVEDEGSKTAQERAKQALGRNDTLAGWACIRLDRLRTGYRFVRLMDARGNPTEGMLLVRIEKLVR